MRFDPKLVIYEPTRSVREPKNFFSFFFVDHSKKNILGKKFIIFRKKLKKLSNFTETIEIPNFDQFLIIEPLEKWATKIIIL